MIFYLLYIVQNVQFLESKWAGYGGTQDSPSLHQRWALMPALALSLSQVGTGNQVLGDRVQRIELNTQRVYSIKRESRLLSDSIFHRTWEWANSEQKLTSGAGRILFLWEDISWLVLAGFYCTCTSSCISLKLLCMWSPMIFLDWPPEKGVTQC